MKEDERKKKFILLDALTDALGRSEGQSLEEVKEDLQNEGIDVDASVRSLMESVKVISMTARRSQMDLAREKRIAAESKQQSFIGKYARWTRDQILARIVDITAEPGLKALVSHRDLESKSTEDLISLLEDMELAKENGEGGNGNNEG
ncbi:MAG: hypothetical protein V2A69_04120 [Pseudomonadota bacterium]